MSKVVASRYREMFGDLDPSDFESYVKVAVRLGSSDIHFEPMQQQLRIRARIEGVLQELACINHPPGKKKPHPLVVQIKARSSLNLQSRIPEDGRFELEVDGKSLSLRVATMPQVFGEKLVIRIFDVGRVADLKGLGFREVNLKRLRSLVDQKSGIVLVTGPTGSGKTTTMYSLLNHLNDPGKNLVTVEDPVEYFFHGINQVQVEAGGVSFDTALRSLLRHDPDILMVGEIRDRLTAEIAFHAAVTGHLVLTTVHARDAIAAFTRLVDLDVPLVVMAQAINGVVAQRLIPKLCSRCAAARPHPPLEEVPMHESVGCPVCLNTGFQGRQGIQEVMVMNDTLRKLLADNVEEEEFRMLALKAGMETLKEDAIFKSIQGQVDYRDAMGITDEPMHRISADIRRMMANL